MHLAHTPSARVGNAVCNPRKGLHASTQRMEAQSARRASQVPMSQCPNNSEVPAQQMATTPPWTGSEVASESQ
eukprot:11904070-Alexandrium_andersonii.AAC.1